MRGFEMRKPNTTQTRTDLRDRDRPAPATAAGHLDDGPEDIDEFRRELTRKMVNFMSGWRDCPDPACRRARACRGRTLACCGNEPKPSPREVARHTARMVHLLRRVCAGAEAEPAPEPAPRAKAKL